MPGRPARPPQPAAQPWHKEVYEPLRIDNQEAAGVYQDLSTKNGKPGKPQKSKVSSGGGVYQQLQAAQEAPSTYQVCSSVAYAGCSGRRVGRAGAFCSCLLEEGLDCNPALCFFLHVHHSVLSPQTINPRPQLPSRGSATPTNPTSPGAEGSLYMGLSDETRKATKETTYMTPDARKS